MTIIHMALLSGQIIVRMIETTKIWTYKIKHPCGKFEKKAQKL